MNTGASQVTDTASAPYGRRFKTVPIVVTEFRRRHYRYLYKNAVESLYVSEKFPSYSEWWFNTKI